MVCSEKSHHDSVFSITTIYTINFDLEATSPIILPVLNKQTFKRSLGTNNTENENDSIINQYKITTI